MSAWPVFLELGLMCDDEGRLIDRPIKKPDGDTHVHEGGLFIVKISYYVEWDEKIKQFISFRGGVHHDGPKSFCYPRDG